MSVLSKLASIFGFASSDPSTDFPASFSTASRGRFRLRRSALTVDGKVTEVFCKYEEVSESDPPRLVFSPDVSRKSDVESWIDLIDRRGPEIVASWTDWLLSDVARIDKKAQHYLRGGVSAAELIRSLHLSTIVLSSDGSFGLRFASAPPIGHCNLSVEFGATGKIEDVSIGG